MSGDDDKIREAFEAAVFQQAFISSVRLNPEPNPRAMGTDRLVATIAQTKAEFCCRNDEGDYVEASLNPAWWAWHRATIKAQLRAQELTDTLHKLTEFNGSDNPCHDLINAVRMAVHQYDD